MTEEGSGGVLYIVRAVPTSDLAKRVKVIQPSQPAPTRSKPHKKLPYVIFTSQGSTRQVESSGGCPSLAAEGGSGKIDVRLSAEQSRYLEVQRWWTSDYWACGLHPNPDWGS